MNTPDQRIHSPVVDGGEQTDRVKKGRVLITAVGHGAVSMTKTQVLRQGRVSSEVYERRLSICRQCPGHHATFRKNGSLRTCGPMLKSMGDPNCKTCGCILKKKARDAAEDCPFGYWPAVASRTNVRSMPRAGRTTSDPVPQSANPYVQTLPRRNRAVSVRAQASSGQKEPAGQDFRVIGAGSDRPITRRGFLGASVASVAVGALGRSVFAQASEPLKYIEISSCATGDFLYILCSEVAGQSEGDVFKASDGKCYEIESVAPIEEDSLRPDRDILNETADEWFDDESTDNCGACEGSSSSSSGGSSGSSGLGSSSADSSSSGIGSSGGSGSSSGSGGSSADPPVSGPGSGQGTGIHLVGRTRLA